MYRVRRGGEGGGEAVLRGGAASADFTALPGGEVLVSRRKGRLEIKRSSWERLEGVSLSMITPRRVRSWPE